MADTLVTLAVASAPAEKLEFGMPEWTVIGDATNAAVTCTRAAVADKQHHCTVVTLSFAATVAAACTFTIKDGTTVIWQAEIPTMDNPAPITFDFQQRPLRAAVNTALVAGLSSPGNIKAVISMSGFTSNRP